MRKLIPIWVGLFFYFSGLAQNTIGLPDIVNYGKHLYAAGTQNWDIQQDRNGILYFANNEGLLSFDGTFWKIFPLPNKTKVRSVAIGKDNKIYVGGEGDFGYFSPNDSGLLHFTSLLNTVGENEKSFSDIWDICTFKNEVFFRASNKIFSWSNNSITVYKPRSHWRFMGECGGLLVAEDFENGLLRYNNNHWEPFLATTDLPKEYLATALIPFGKDSCLLTTLENGLYIISNNQATKLASTSLQAISANRIYDATRLNNNLIALATSLDGCYIIDNKGEYIQSLSASDGLQNNNVLSVFLDRDDNLWIGTDNGIDFIAYNNSIRHIYPESRNEGPGYAALLYHDYLYMGTSNGLSRIGAKEAKDISLIKGTFEPVANTKGQVWGLAEINDQLLLAHHEGAFLVKGNTSTAILPVNGFWNFSPLDNVYPTSIIAAGTYYGVNFFTYNKDGSFSKTGVAANFSEASRFMAVQDAKTIWVSHPYRGIYKLGLTDTVWKAALYTEKNGLPASTNNNYIFKIKNQIVAATEKGIYLYNPANDRFAIADFYKEILGDTPLLYLKEDTQGNVWFIQGKQLGVIDLTGPKPQLIHLPELNEKMVSGFEYIYPVDEHNILVGAEKGFYHIDFAQYKRLQNHLQVQLRLVKAFGKTEQSIFGGYFGEVNDTVHQSDKQVMRINHDLNSLRFEFSSTLYGQQSSIEYSYYLKGFDKDWAPWGKKTEKEYTKLPAGRYTFLIKVRNNLGNESKVTEYSFIVLPPWYQTYWAYGLYFLLALIGFYVIYKRQVTKFKQQQLKHEEEQKRLQYLHQLELEKNEREIIKLKNEKLEADITYKNSELALSAMHLVQKTEILGTIKSDLGRIMKGVDPEKTSDDIKKLIKMLGEENKTDKDWEQFSVHFDNVHSNFLVAVKEKYPTLNPSDLKLCAYLRMNLSTKEMARILNISVRGVEISRYRLRKKLQIPTETNLFNFFLNFYGGKEEAIPNQVRPL